MHVVVTLKEYPGFNEPRHATISVPEGMDRDKEKMRQQCANDRVLICKPSGVYELRVIFHQLLNALIRSALMNTAHIWTADRYRERPIFARNVVVCIGLLCRRLMYIQQIERTKWHTVW